MQAVILAAGEGTRLRPYTNLTPKPLFTIGGKPIITHIIDKLSNLGVPNQDIFIVVSYMKEEISGYLRRFHENVKIVEQNPNKKGTLAALESVKDELNDENVLVIYGDLFFEDSLKEIIDKDYVICVTEVEDVSKFGKVITEGSYLKEIREKTESGRGFIFAGILKFRKDFFQVFSEVKPNEKSGEYYLTDAILLQNRKTRFLVHKLKGFWFDIGNESSLLEARKVFYSRMSTLKSNSPNS